MAIRFLSGPIGAGRCFAPQGMRIATAFGLAMTCLFWLLLLFHPGQSPGLVGGGDAARPTGTQGKKKAPGAIWLQGRIADPWYHPGCLPGEAASGSDKPYPGNGGNRVPLLRRCLSRDRLGNQTPGPAAPVRTNHRLSGALKSGGFFLHCLYTIYR